MTGKTVLWCCDPMHGNTQRSEQGTKIRYFDDILAELNTAIAIHQQYDSILGGLHLEMTGERVTECIGGSCKVRGSYHKPLVDPRLNYEQSMELLLSS